MIEARTHSVFCQGPEYDTTIRAPQSPQPATIPRQQEQRDAALAARLDLGKPQRAGRHLQAGAEGQRRLGAGLRDTLGHQHLPDVLQAPEGVGYRICDVLFSSRNTPNLTPSTPQEPSAAAAAPFPSIRSSRRATS